MSNPQSLCVLIPIFICSERAADNSSSAIELDEYDVDKNCDSCDGVEDRRTLLIISMKLDGLRMNRVMNMNGSNADCWMCL